MAWAEKVYKVRNGKQTKQFTWRARWTKPDGKPGTWPGFPTKKLAEEYGEKQEAAIRAGRWIDPAKQQEKFGVFARRWMKAKPKRGATVAKRWNLLEQHIFPKWEHVSLINITWFDVDDWQLNELTCESVTAGHAVSLMSSIMTGAVDARYLEVNPLFGRRRTLRTGTVAAPSKPKKTDEEKWAPPEVVLQMARRLGPAVGLHVLTTAFTGLGWGEGAALHRDNALRTRRQAHDGGWFECPIIRVDPEVGELAEYEGRDADGEKTGLVLRLEPPKNGNRARDIDIPPFLADLLARHMEVWPHPYLFCTPSGTFWRRSNFTRAHIRPAADGRKALTVTRGRAERAAWEPIMPGLTMRDLRHTHDTYQDQLGVKASLAYDQAGHLRPGIKRIYQHPTPEMRAERLAGLQGIYERAMGTLGWSEVWPAVADVGRKTGPPNSPQTILKGEAEAA
jgi:integrase